MSVLSSKELRHFATSEAAFRAWAEERSPEEVEQAIVEINGYVADQERQLDEEIAYQRNLTLQQKDAEKQHLQAQLDFVNYHPEFIVGEPSATILSTRAKQLLAANGLDPKTTPFTVDLLEQAFRELVNEQRIDWDPKKGSPWGRIHYKHDSEGPERTAEPTQEELEAEAESLSTEELIEKSGGVVQDTPDYIAAERQRTSRFEGSILPPGLRQPESLTNPEGKGEVEYESVNAAFTATGHRCSPGLNVFLYSSGISITLSPPPITMAQRSSLFNRIPS